MFTSFRLGDMVTSSEGKSLGEQVWCETVDALEKEVPEVESLAGSGKEL